MRSEAVPRRNAPRDASLSACSSRRRDRREILGAAVLFEKRMRLCVAKDCFQSGERHAEKRLFCNMLGFLSFSFFNVHVQSFPQQKVIIVILTFVKL